MKKNVLSLSVAAMIGGLALSGAASAGIAYPVSWFGGQPAGLPIGTLATSNATHLVVNPNGIGHILLVPYYSVQEGNGTLLSIVNTDETNGKAVKVRFRSASNSDDVFAFSLFMSPGDVWTANVSKDAATGLAQLYTPDNSCTLPSRAAINATKFKTGRVYGADDAAKAGETLEGYVEILTMADIPPKLPATVAGVVAQDGASAITNPLFTAIKHNAAGTTACTSDASLPAAVAKLGSDPALNAPTSNTDTAAAADRLALLQHGIWTPTTGLTGNWTIINVAGASVAWSSDMTAIEARTGNDAASTAAGGRVVFSPQKDDEVPAERINLLTADPLMRNTGTAPSSAIVKAAQNDLPDLSTPYLTVERIGTSAPDAPVNQADRLTQVLAVRNVINEYVTNKSISAATDWVFSMPTRRYAVVVDYKSKTPVTVFNTTAAQQVAAANISQYFTNVNTEMGAGGNSGNPTYQACVKPGGELKVYDQEEATSASGEFVVSPGTAKKVVFCGETSVLTFNKTSSLKAKLAVKDVDAGYANGWLNINTQGLGANGLGLPILGSAFVKMTGPMVSGKSTNFSITQPHRYVKAP